MKSAATEVNYPVATTDASGFFTVFVGTLPNDTYNWRVKGPSGVANTNTTPGFLASVGTLSITGDNPTIQSEMGLLKGGDANNDNVVNAIDLSIYRATQGRACGDQGFDGRADFNGDCVVDILDFTLLRGNYGLGGPGPIR